MIAVVFTWIYIHDDVVQNCPHSVPMSSSWLGYCTVVLDGDTVGGNWVTRTQGSSALFGSFVCIYNYLKSKSVFLTWERQKERVIMHTEKSNDKADSANNGIACMEV